VFQHDHTPSPLACGEGAHQARGTAASQHDRVEMTLHAISVMFTIVGN
jgi:hypothetical protein